MRVAYADPPYVGQAKRHYGSDPAAAEVDHAALIAQLEADYDGWALSLWAQSLPLILPLCPAEIRVCAWVKPFAAWKSCNPAYSWEPVIVRQPRKANYPRVRDWVSANMTTQRGTHGAKPDEFSFWLFHVLNLMAEDELIDLFPGSGAVGRAWERWRRQAPSSVKRKGRTIRPRPLFTEAV